MARAVLSDCRMSDLSPEVRQMVKDYFDHPPPKGDTAHQQDSQKGHRGGRSQPKGGHVTMEARIAQREIAEQSGYGDDGADLLIDDINRVHARQSEPIPLFAGGAKAAPTPQKASRPMSAKQVKKQRDTRHESAQALGTELKVICLGFEQDMGNLTADLPEIERAKVTIKSADEKLQRANDKLARVQAFVDRVSANEAGREGDELQNALDVANADKDKAEANVEAAKQERGTAVLELGRLQKAWEQKATAMLEPLSQNLSTVMSRDFASTGVLLHREELESGIKWIRFTVGRVRKLATMTEVKGFAALASIEKFLDANALGKALDSDAQATVRDEIKKTLGNDNDWSALNAPAANQHLDAIIAQASFMMSTWPSRADETDAIQAMSQAYSAIHGHLGMASDLLGNIAGDKLDEVMKKAKKAEAVVEALANRASSTRAEAAKRNKPTVLGDGFLMDIGDLATLAYGLAHGE